MPSLNPKTTALILIDLQKGIIGRDLVPRSGAQVVETSRALADRFRAVGAPVILVHVELDTATRPPQNVDAPSMPADPPAGFTDFVDGLRQPGDIVVTKHHWGAFTGTDLDLRLRRLGVKTVVIGGIATNFGVESTARSAWEHSYDVVIVEDACASAKTDMHEFAVNAIFPRISRVVRSSDVTLG